MRFPRCLLPWSMLAIVAWPALLMAQQDIRSAEGRVQRPVAAGGDSAGMAPAAGAWVTLHRVGKDNAGPIDSMRTDGSGRYRFAYRPTGAADAVYFASTTWGGIAYFTAPLRSGAARGDETEITVFDTTSRAFPVAIKGRHLIVSKSDSTDMRTVVEVFELSNDSLKTLIAPGADTPAPTWSVAIPASAQDVRVNEGEISPEAFAATNGRVAIFAPIAPGVKQVAFSYKLPNSSFPLSLTSESNVVVFEVLLEEPQGSVTGKGFAAVAPVSLEGRNFRRFLSQDLPADTRLIVELPSTGTPGRNVYIVALLVGIGFLMLLVLIRSMQRAASRRVVTLPTLRPKESEAPLAERLAQEIAALDAVFARQTQPTEAVRTAYEQRRQELRAALEDALAANPVGR